MPDRPLTIGDLRHLLTRSYEHNRANGGMFMRADEPIRMAASALPDDDTAPVTLTDLSRVIEAVRASNRANGSIFARADGMLGVMIDALGEIVNAKQSTVVIKQGDLGASSQMHTGIAPAVRLVSITDGTGTVIPPRWFIFHAPSGSFRWISNEVFNGPWPYTVVVEHL